MLFYTNKNTHEERYSSQIKELTISFKQKAAFLQNLHFQDLMSDRHYDMALDGLLEESSMLLANLGVAVSDLESEQHCDMSDFFVQSGIDLTPVELSNSETVENVAFVDTPNDVIVSIPHPMSYTKVDCSQNVELGKYLQRPVQIFQTDWAIGDTIDYPATAFAPWRLYFEKPAIKRKLDNYYLLRCNLHLKFVINASPFYYGALMAAYEPLIQMSPAPIHQSVAGRIENVSLSQRPHLYMYPANSQGGEMVLPFLYFKNWLDATSGSDLSNMGEVILSSFDTLKNANGVSSDSISIVVYAWADDLEIAGPTIELAVQSDEYQTDGVVSRPASAIARAAGLLGSVPIIGPFATATSYAAGAIADIASLFGYTNVPVIDDVHAFRSKPFPNIAATDIGTPVEKLTLDSKNELSIDPKISGANVDDELLISSFVARESYIFTSSWDSTDPIDTGLFYSKVSPNMIRTAVDSNQTIIWGTPMDHVARCFKYWRGDIIFRFKIICTKYHKGRIRVCWDPKGGIGTIGDYTTEVYTKVIDISQDTDVEFRVPYTQQTAYLKTDPTINQHMAESSTSVADVGTVHNGIITMRVLNVLTSPVASSDIKILCFVRGADNLEFACPKELPPRTSFYSVQSESYDLALDTIDMGETPSTVDPNLNLIYMGENIPTLRQLMRRTSAYVRIANPLSSSNDEVATVTTVLGRSPMYPGYDPEGVQTAIGLISTNSEPYNWVNWTYTTWFSACFVGVRGSYHYTANPCYTDDIKSVRLSRSSKVHTASEFYTQQYRVLNGEYKEFMKDFTVDGLQPSGLEGMSLTNQQSQAGLMVSVPMYSRYKFLGTAVFARTEGTDIDDTNTDSITIDTVVKVGASTNVHNLYHDLYVSAGTDFSLVFFLNVPSIYQYSSVPLI